LGYAVVHLNKSEAFKTRVLKWCEKHSRFIDKSFFNVLNTDDTLKFYMNRHNDISLAFDNVLQAVEGSNVLGQISNYQRAQPLDSRSLGVETRKTLQFRNSTRPDYCSPSSAFGEFAVLFAEIAQNFLDSNGMSSLTKKRLTTENRVPLKLHPSE
jgi:hypothetical protein